MNEFHVSNEKWTRESGSCSYLLHLKTLLMYKFSESDSDWTDKQMRQAIIQPTELYILQKLSCDVKSNYEQKEYPNP